VTEGPDPVGALAPRSSRVMPGPADQDIAWFRSNEHLRNARLWRQDTFARRADASHAFRCGPGRFAFLGRGLIADQGRTAISFFTAFTPATLHARRSASLRSALFLANPDSMTVPFSVSTLIALMLGGCAGMSRQEVSTVTGAAVGAVAGSVVGGVAVAGGAVVGGVIGQEVAKK